MKNNYGTVHVKNIIAAGGKLKMTIDLDDVELNGNVELEIRERLEAEEGIDDVESFDWEVVEPGAEEADKIEKIKAVLRRYFDTTDDGEVSPDFDEDFSAQDTIDEIHDIVGDI